MKYLFLVTLLRIIYLFHKTQLRNSTVTISKPQYLYLCAVLELQTPQKENYQTSATLLQ
jgi:hypothetical protein